MFVSVLREGNFGSYIYFVYTYGDTDGRGDDDCDDHGGGELVWPRIKYTTGV